jgi:hypothetical protein
LPASNIDLRFTREDSTYGAGSRIEVPGSETSGTVSLSIPDPGGVVGYSTPWNTRGGASTFHGATEPPPDGKGWFLHDTSVLDGFRAYNDAATTGTIDFETFSGAIDADVYLRVYKYTISTGTYIKIGSIFDGTTSFQQSRNAVMTGTMGISGPFDADNILYVDAVWHFPDGTSTARTVNLRTGNGISVLSLRIRPNSEVAPANDNLANATDIGSAPSGQVSASNFFSSYEVGEVKNGPAGDGVVYNKVYGGLGLDANGSLWWKWTCPTVGGPEKVQFDCFGTLTTSVTDGETGQFVRLDTRLRIYTSPTPLAPVHATLVEVAENDDSGSYYPFSSEGSNAKIILDTLTPGETYFIQLCCQTRGAESDESPTATPPGGSFNNLRHGLMRLNWSMLYRGPWVQPADVVFDNTDLPGLANYGNGDVPGQTGSNPFHQTKQYHGYTSIWGFAGYPSPHDDPDAYWLASLRCHCGDQSIDETGNNTEIGWDPPNTWLPGAYRLNGSQIWDMGGSNQYSGVGDGSGANGADLSSGGFASILPPGLGAGALCNWSTYWGFSVFNPLALAYASEIWSYTGSLPSGASEAVYSKNCADIVSFKVRPAAQGSSAHPASGTFGTVITGEWWELPNNSPAAPEWGLYRNASGLLVCRTNTPPGGWPIGLPGDMRTMAGTLKIGEVTFTSGVRTAITTAWREPPEWQYVITADTDTWTNADEYYAGFGVDFVLDDATMGYQGGTPTWSFTRHIEGQDLEFEIVLRKPCYAFMYTGQQYDLGTIIFTDDCSSTAAWTHADPFAIVSGRFQFVTSPQDAYQDLGAAEGDTIQVEFDFEPPADLSGIGGGEFVSFYEGGSTTRHIYGNLANLTGTVTWQVGAATVLTSTGLVQAGSHRYKVQVKIGDGTSGFIRVYRDDVLHSQLNVGDTRNGGTDGLIDRVLWGAHGNTTYLDNVEIGTATLVNDDCPPLEPPPVTGVEPPLRMIQRDDDNGLRTDGSQTPRLLNPGNPQRASSEQRSQYPRLQTRNGKGYR